MAWLALLFATGCTIGAILNRNDRVMCAFLLCCVLLNGAAAVSMFATRYEYAWRLAPSQGDSDPGYHYRR